MVVDEVGNGRPIAWCIANSETTAVYEVIGGVFKCEIESVIDRTPPDFGMKRWPPTALLSDLADDSNVVCRCR
jgi:hypothetical protein